MAEIGECYICPSRRHISVTLTIMQLGNTLQNSRLCHDDLQEAGRRAAEGALICGSSKCKIWPPTSSFLYEKKNDEIPKAVCADCHIGMRTRRHTSRAATQPETFAEKHALDAHPLQHAWSLSQLSEVLYCRHGTQ